MHVDVCDESLGSLFFDIKMNKHYQNYLGNYSLKFELHILNYGKMLEILPNLFFTLVLSQFSSYGIFEYQGIYEVCKQRFPLSVLLY